MAARREAVAMSAGMFAFPAPARFGFSESDIGDRYRALCAALASKGGLSAPADSGGWRYHRPAMKAIAYGNTNGYRSHRFCDFTTVGAA